MSKNLINLSQAKLLAKKIKGELSPGCKRIEIAGSVRRNKAQVGDIEIVIVPDYELVPSSQLSLLGEEAAEERSKLDQVLEGLLSSKPHFSRGDKNGGNYKNFKIKLPNGGFIQLDLFITTLAQWGYIFALRTGPSEFNIQWVTQKAKGGLLPNDCRFKGGWLYRNGQKVKTPEEEDIFNLIGGWVPPDKRCSIMKV